MRNRRQWFGGVVLCLAVAGCSGAGALDESEMGDESAALVSGNLDEGTSVVTTTRLNLREGPSLSDRVIEVLPARTVLTIVDGTPENSYYHVALADGSDGYCHGSYLKAASGSEESASSDTQSGAVGAAQGESFRTRGTGYFPDSSAMEGGFVDRRGAKLRTLQQYLAGNADYVSVAMDTNAFGYGQKLRIRELEEKYGRVIEFRVVDTGGAFRGKGRSRVDICVANRSASLDATINGMLTVTIGLD
jgi:uncharacterized protein YgiM (DUF1202 family)